MNKSIKEAKNLIFFFSVRSDFISLGTPKLVFSVFQAQSDARPPGLITKTSLFKYTENFTTKNENFQIKNSDIFHISAQNIDCGYSLEPPRRGGSNEYPQSMF